MLLPEPPTSDLVELLNSHEVRCVVKRGDGSFRTLSASPVSDVAALMSACLKLGDPALWFRPLRYPDGLALCIIDSIQSTGAHYASVVNIVNRYRAERGDAAKTDGTAELLRTFEEHGGADGWAASIGNRKPASTKAGAPLKAAIVERVARALHDAGIRTTHDLREHASLEPGNEGRRASTKKLWTSIEAQRSGITWEYALMLAGLPGVKADRMVLRFVAEATGRNDVTPESAAKLVRDAAKQMDVSATDLDHAIWRSASGRAFQTGV